MNGATRRPLVAAFLLTIGVIGAAGLPVNHPGQRIGVPTVFAAKPDRTPPGNGKPTPEPPPVPTPEPPPVPTPEPPPVPTPEPPPVPTPEPTAKATSEPTPKATAAPTTKATAAPTTRATAVPTTTKGPDPKPIATSDSAAEPSPSPAPVGAGPSSSSADPSATTTSVGVGSIGPAAPGDAGPPIGIVGFGLLGGAGGLLLLARRRRRAPEEEPEEGRVPADGGIDIGLFDDPLLQAMATTSRDRALRGPRASSASDPTPIAPWVQRLDAEINVLSDLASRPMPPPARKEPESVGTEDSLSA